MIWSLTSAISWDVTRFFPAEAHSVLLSRWTWRWRRAFRPPGWSSAVCDRNYKRLFLSAAPIDTLDLPGIDLRCLIVLHFSTKEFNPLLYLQDCCEIGEVMLSGLVVRRYNLLGTRGPAHQISTTAEQFTNGRNTNYSIGKIHQNSIAIQETKIRYREVSYVPPQMMKWHR